MRTDICFVHDHKRPKGASLWSGLLAQLEEICAHSHQALGGQWLALHSCPRHCGKTWASSKAVPENTRAAL